jgi:hypothetical protein
MKKINDLTIVVDVDGTLLISTGFGSASTVVFTSDNQQLVIAAKKAATLKTHVEFLPHTPALVAGWETPLGILAAMLAVSPGRCYIHDAPNEVLESLKEVIGEPKQGAIY